MTDKEKTILIYIKETPTNIGNFAAYEIARDLGGTSQGIAATLRSLFNQGYVTKSPFGNFIVYAISDKGTAALT